MRVCTRIFGLVLAIPFLLSTASSQTDRVVLIEDFSSVTCVNCPQASAIINKVAAENPVRVVTIQYHLDIPGRNDPFYALNKADNDARASFFGGFNSLPQVYIDGFSGAPTNEAAVRSDVSSRLTEPTSLSVVAEQVDFEGKKRVTITASSPEGLGSGYKLFAVVVEALVHRSEEYFKDTARSQPYYGETEFHDLFRSFVSPSGGVDVSLNRGEPMEFTFDYTPGESWIEDDLYIVAWIQDDFTLEVAQAGYSTRPSNSVRDDRNRVLNGLTLSPNPVTDQLHIELPNSTVGRTSTVQLFDAKGRLVLEEKIESSGIAQSFDVSQLSSGLYTVIIDSQDGRYQDQVLLIR